jgi:hypothetical protein
MNGAMMGTETAAGLPRIKPAVVARRSRWRRDDEG